MFPSNIKYDSDLFSNKISIESLFLYFYYLEKKDKKGRDEGKEREKNYDENNWTYIFDSVKRCTILKQKSTYF